MSDNQRTLHADTKSDVHNGQVFVHKEHKIKFTVIQDSNGNLLELSEYTKLDMLKLYSMRSLLTYYFVQKFSNFELNEKLPLSLVLECFAQMKRIDERNKYDIQYSQQVSGYVEETENIHINSALNPHHELPKQYLFPIPQQCFPRNGSDS